MYEVNYNDRTSYTRISSYFCCRTVIWGWESTISKS